MFTYNLKRRDKVTMSKDGELKFDPPVYEQRYSTTLQILEDPRWSAQLKKVVEFGCSQMRLLPLMRRIDTVEHIMEVDIDEPTLISHKNRGVPLTADYLKRREHPLRIEIFRGSITDSVDNLRNVDAVIALEVIEHLDQDVLERVPQNIFGFIQPKLFIVSTPNRDYNVLFKGLNANGFRIDDHRFEWTRKEFRGWARNICEQFPNYSVAYIGIGSPPKNHLKLGHVTQMAIFARNDIINYPLKASILNDLVADTRSEIQYKEIFAVDFPYYSDERTTKQKITDEVVDYISRSQSAPKYFNSERCIYQIPIMYLIEYAQSINSNEEDVLSALHKLKIQVENEFLILTEEYVEENYRRPFKNLYEEYLNYDEIEDDNSQENSTKYIDNDEPEESWD